MGLKKDQKEQTTPYKPTSGEQFIENYFIEQNIKYEPQKKIYPQNDIKNFRKVDFYLPKLNVYVEYHGMYFSGDKYKKDYDIKTQVYINNNYATVVIYPNEIGVLDYAFHSKLKNLLNMEKFKNPKSFFIYTLNRYLRKGKGFLFFSFIFWAYLFLVFAFYPINLDEGFKAILILTTLTITCYYCVRFFSNIIDYFYYKN